MKVQKNKYGNEFVLYSSYRPERKPHSKLRDTAEPLAKTQQLLNAGFTESLNTIDSESPTRHTLVKKRWYRLTKRRIIVFILLVLLAAGGYFGYRILTPVVKLSHGNLLSLITPGTPLETDSEGRTNIVIFGTSQDDAAHQNANGGGGLWLTDSIMLVSMNQQTHVVKTISIPRDLWTTMPAGCSVGYQAKINAVYECGGGLQNFDSSEQKATDYTRRDQAGANALEASIQKVTGITPQYYVHVNYTVLQQAVDAVGGIQVAIQGDGADGIYDTNFDWNCPKGPYTCKNVYYPHNGTYTLDGQQALYLARARADTGIYSYKDFGLDQGDFDRQINQQKILAAIKQKALSVGTLANPVALTNLLDALGNNITTDLQAGNYKTLIDYVNKMPKTNGMQSVSLVQKGHAVVENQEVDGQSAVVATSGLLDYTSIINYIARQLSTNPAVAENASIAIYNASNVEGVAGQLKTRLTASGLTVTATGNASTQDAGPTTYTIYDTTNGKMPQTLAYLKSELSGSQVATQAVPSELSGSADIIIVIGSAS